MVGYELVIDEWLVTVLHSPVTGALDRWTSTGRKADMGWAWDPEIGDARHYR